MRDSQLTLKRVGMLSALSPRLLFALTAAISVLISSALCAGGRYRDALALSAAGLVAASIIFSGVSVSSILTVWFLTSPLASFYVRFPLDKSLITYNRAMVALAVLTLAGRRWFRREPETGPPRDGAGISRSGGHFTATRFEILWAALSVAALASALLTSNDAGYATKLAVDTFMLPLALFHLARNHFDWRGRKNALLICAIALAIFLFATGAYEFLTGTNLFQYKGSELVREGERRVNGPFQSDSSYAAISLLIAVFLQSMPRALNARLGQASRLICSCALAAAVIAAVLPMFRATAIAVVVCLLILRLSENRRGRAVSYESGEARIDDGQNAAERFLNPASSPPPPALNPLIVALLLGVAGIAVSLGYLSSSHRLTDPRNAFGRLATWETAAGFAIDNPLLGVGLANYQDYFRSRFNWEDESVERVMDTRAANSPHSNLFWIAAELGAIAFALYAGANICLFLIGWRALKKSETAPARAAALCFIALFAAYWIHGLTLASGYYSDLNLYFFFMLGLLSNKSLVSAS